MSFPEAIPEIFLALPRCVPLDSWQVSWPSSIKWSKQNIYDQLWHFLVFGINKNQPKFCVQNIGASVIQIVGFLAVLVLNETPHLGAFLVFSLSPGRRMAKASEILIGDRKMMFFANLGRNHPPHLGILPAIFEFRTVNLEENRQSSICVPWMM